MKTRPMLASFAALVCLTAGALALSGGRLAIAATDASAPATPFDNVAPARGAVRVYQNSFENAPGPEWSVNTISQTKNGGRPFLGEIPSRKPVTLAINNLPAHDLVRITFDLYLLNGWNGCSPYWGFSRWDMNLGDGRNLIHTSFSNEGIFDDRLNLVCPHNEQSFPDSYDLRAHYPYTGATEKGTLRPGGEDESSVYHMVLTFPHTDRDILFAFQSVIQEGNNRTWGLASVSVETLLAPPLHTQGELADLWKNLGDVDSVKACAAQWELATAGDQAVDYIARHLDEDINLVEEDIATLVRDLETVDGEHLGQQFELITHQGAKSLGVLRKAATADGLSDEYKDRLRAAFYYTKRHPATATQLRIARATQVLEIIHTKSAIALKLTIPEPTPRGVDAPNPVLGVKPLFPSEKEPQP